MFATTTVFWPGQTVTACDHHTRQLKAVAEVLGFKLDTAPLEAKDNELCLNCVNEEVDKCPNPQQ